MAIEDSLAWFWVGIKDAPLYTGAVVAICLFLGFLRYRSRSLDLRFATAHGCLPLKKLDTGPWPLGLKLVLHAFQVAREHQILQLFVQIIEETGHTFEQKLFGSVGIDTVEPQNIEAILSTQFPDFELGDRRPTFLPLLGNGIFTQDGVSWKHSRELLRPQFLLNRSQDFNEISKHVERLIARICPDEPVDLQPLFFRFTLDTTTSLLFGRTVGAIENADKESTFAKAFGVAQDYLARRGRLGGLYWLIDGSEFRKACSTVHAFVDNIVRDALQAETSDVLSSVDSTPKYVFLNALIQETRDPVVLRDQLLNILLAGRDTTACLLSWTLRLLARHQQVLNRLRDEVESTVGVGSISKPPTRSDLKKMKYLETVVKEVLRLYPSVPVNSRTASKTTTLPKGGGVDGEAPILVRRGEAVGYCVYAMHRRKDLYGQDANDFRPERWEEDPTLKKIGWGYLPFNSGPRVCLGQEFALLESSYAIVRLVQAFPSIRLPTGEQILPPGAEKQTLTLVLSSTDGCWVQMGREYKRR